MFTTSGVCTSAINTPCVLKMVACINIYNLNNIFRYVYGNYSSPVTTTTSFIQSIWLKIKKSWTFIVKIRRHVHRASFLYLLAIKSLRNVSSDLNSENLHQRNTKFPRTAVSHILCRHQLPPLPRCPQSRSPARNGSQSRPAWSPRSASEAGRKHRWIPYRIWHENTLICRTYLRIFHFFHT